MKSNSTKELDRYLELHKVPISPTLTAEETATVARLHVEVVELGHRARPYSKALRNAARESLRQRVSAAKSIDERKRLATELAIFNRDGRGNRVPADDIHAGLERERIHKLMESAKILAVAYDRELTTLRAHRNEIAALDLCPLGLSASAFLKRIDETISRLDRDRAACARVIAGEDLISRPADLAAAFGFDFDKARNEARIPAPKLDDEWGDLRGAAAHISANVDRFAPATSQDREIKHAVAAQAAVAVPDDGDGLLEEEE